MNIPIIRFEIEGIRQQLHVAIGRYAAQMDADLKAAVEDYCTPENINRIIKSAADTAITKAIQEEVKAFFLYGDGRKAVAQAVKESILKKETYTPLDDV